MVILLNGAFGIGKSTVATLVCQQLPSSLVLDPEKIGFVLQRLPRWVRLEGSGRDDFQHFSAWRRLTVRAARVCCLLCTNLIVPMAFSETAYLREVRDGIAAFDPEVVHFCLVAPVGIVHQRLARRGTDPGDPEGAWQYRRAAECCAVHRHPEFAEHVPAERQSAEAVAADLSSRIRAHQAAKGADS